MLVVVIVKETLGVVNKSMDTTGIQCFWLLRSLLKIVVCSLHTMFKELKHFLDVGFQNKYAMSQLQLSKYAANICSKIILLFLNYIYICREQYNAPYIFNSLQL